MGSGDDAKKARSLRLTRETLRDLPPTPADVAAVRGGDSSTCGAKEFCVLPEAVFDLLGKTSMSYGCNGTVHVRPVDGGFDITLDLQPNDATREMQAMMMRRLEQG